MTEYTELRQFDRYPLMMDAKVAVHSVVVACTLFDISAGGAKVRLNEAGKVALATPAAHLVLDIPWFGGFAGQIVWTDDEYIGIKFLDNHEKAVKIIVETATRTAA